MSNAGYIVYLQAIVADNTAKITAASQLDAALGQAIIDAAAQSATLVDQQVNNQSVMIQLFANNALLANLIAQLQASK